MSKRREEELTKWRNKIAEQGITSTRAEVESMTPANRKIPLTAIVEDDGYSYAHFCHLFAEWQGKQKRSMRQVHVAGEKCFVDYAGTTVPIVNRATGEYDDAQIFFAVLGASGYTFAHASLSQTEADWIHSQNAAFAFFGGVSEIVVPDSLKSAVTKARPWVSKINAAYQSRADYTGTVVIPARVRKPKDKDPAVTPVNKGGWPCVTRDRVANAIDLSTTRIVRAPTARELRTALGDADTNHESAQGHVVEKPSSLESRHIKHPRR